MNSLSWLLYLAEASQRVSNLCGFLACMVGLFGAAGIFGLWAYTNIERQPKTLAVVATCAWALVMPILLAGATLLPSSKTIYMIAASEAGEAVVTHPDTIEMMGDLKAIIKKRLKEELGE